MINNNHFYLFLLLEIILMKYTNNHNEAQDNDKSQKLSFRLMSILVRNHIVQ